MPFGAYDEGFRGRALGDKTVDITPWSRVLFVHETSLIVCFLISESLFEALTHSRWSVLQQQPFRRSRSAPPPFLSALGWNNLAV